MNEESIASDPWTYSAAESVFLRLFGIDGNGHDREVAINPPIPEFAAADIFKLFKQPFATKPDVEALKDVIRISGRTAWASATALDAQTATRQACSQHDMKTAKGVLVIITLSPDSSIVPSIKAALTAIYRKTPAVTARAFAVAHDETLHRELRVEILLTGL